MNSLAPTADAKASIQTRPGHMNRHIAAALVGIRDDVDLVCFAAGKRR